jgi:hypothetical protein
LKFPKKSILQVRENPNQLKFPKKINFAGERDQKSIENINFAGAREPKSIEVSEKNQFCR